MKHNTLKKNKKFPKKQSFNKNKNKHLHHRTFEMRKGVKKGGMNKTKKLKPKKPLLIIEEDSPPIVVDPALATTVTEEIALTPSVIVPAAVLATTVTEEISPPSVSVAAPKKIELAEMDLKTPTQKIVEMEMELPTGRLNEKFIDLMDKLAAVVANQGETANERMQARFKARAYKKAQETNHRLLIERKAEA